MRDVQDGRQVLLAPVDGVRETAHQHQDGVGIGLYTCFSKSSSGNISDFASQPRDRRSARGRRTSRDVCHRGGCPHKREPHRPAGGIHSLVYRVVGSIEHFRLPAFHGVADTVQDSHFVSRGYRYTSLHNLVGIRPYHGLSSAWKHREATGSCCSSARQPTLPSPRAPGSSLPRVRKAALHWGLYRCGGKGRQSPCRPAGRASMPQTGCPG